MIVTIDGPAGAGKTSAARALAARLGFEVLDTGAMYRVVTLAALRQGVDPNDQEALGSLLETTQMQFPPGRAILNGEDVSSLIRTSEITQASGAIASSPPVRRHLVALQRAVAAGRNMVCEGRDQGTIVFPDALCKFFLKAEPAERARRRQSEMVGRGEEVGFDQVLRAQDERDRRDAARDLAPMVPAADAIIVDNTRLGPEQVLELLEREVRRRLPGTKPG
jgi:cytidylate kinase